MIVSIVKVGMVWSMLVIVNIILVVCCVFDNKIFKGIVIIIVNNNVNIEI